MTQSIENALRALYRENGRRVLEDDAFFLGRLEALYQPEWKADCRLLSRAVAAGLGREADAFAAAGRAPTREEQDRMKTRLMAASPELYDRDAARALALYGEMLGWGDASGRGQGDAVHLRLNHVKDAVGRSMSRQGQGRGAGSGAKKKWGALDYIGLVLIIIGALGIAYGIYASAVTGMSLDMMFKAIDTSTMMGAMFGNGSQMTAVDLLVLTIVRYRWHLLLGGLALKFVPGLWKQLKPAA